MASRISELVIPTLDPQRVAAFCCEVPDFIVHTEDDSVVEIGPGEGFGGLQLTLIFIPTIETKAGQLRLHLNVNATDRDQDAELEGLLKLGARPADIGQTGEEALAPPRLP